MTINSGVSSGILTVSAVNAECFLDFMLHIFCNLNENIQNLQESGEDVLSFSGALERRHADSPLSMMLATGFL